MNAQQAIQEKKSGVYVLSEPIGSAELEQIARQQGLQFFQLEGAAIENKRAFLRAISAVLHFPAHFGHNWDALLDMLRDLSWLPGAGYVLLLSGLGKFAEHDRDEYATALDVLRDAAHFAAEKGSTRPLIILIEI